MHEGEQWLHHGELSLQQEVVHLRVVVQTRFKVLPSSSVEISISFKACLAERKEKEIQPPK